MSTLRKSVPFVLNLIILFLVGMTIGLVACSNNANNDAYAQARQVARDALWTNINSGKASCATVALMVDGKIVYSEGFGMADREKSIPVDAKTVFNIGSTSKTFDAVAIMKLVDEGKVDLDAPVTQYLPEFTMADPRYKDITVRMCLDHTSGLPGTNYANNMGYAFNTPIYEETLADLSQAHLKADPGAMAPYCNDGFTLAEMIIANVSGQSFMDFLSANIFKPLSLSAGPSVGQRTDATPGAFYVADSGIKYPLEVLSVLGAGGLSCTAEDLVKFGDTFSGKGTQVLSDSSRQEMMKASPSTLAEDSLAQTGINPEIWYGLGLDYTDIPFYRDQGIKVIGKGGDSDVYHSELLIVPDQRIVVAVIQAGQGSGAPDAAIKILDSVLQSKGLLQPAPKQIVPPQPQPVPASYTAFDGYYVGEKPFQLSYDAATSTLNIHLGGATAPLSYDGKLFATPSGTRFALLEVDGNRYAAASMLNDMVYMMAGQQAPAAVSPMSLSPDINGAQWLRRNAKPFESMSFDDAHIAISNAIPGLPGYVDFAGYKIVMSPTFAGMPVGAVRDQTELTLFPRDGATWAQLSDELYSPSSVAAAFGGGTSTIIIGADNYNEWLKASSDLIVSFNASAGDRVIVFGPDGTHIYDSEIDTGEVYVPAGGFIELSGVAGDRFAVTGRPATSG